ncbi:baseplate J/gp47 family protein [Lichenicola sp.]|uniref:baseplate J/gp47 family protein n=1 Tax=Lichenicola sp. TaxID=2804529 RepID=UPI003AFFEADD
MTNTTTTSPAAGISTIFVGGSLDLDALSNPAISTPLLADGDVSFYGHMNGLVTTYDAGTEQSLIKTWTGTGAGVTELGMGTEMAIMNVTIANTSKTAIEVPVGTIVSSAGGVQYAITQTDDGGNGWSAGGAGDGSNGYFTIQPGASLTLMAQAVQNGVSGNLLDNQVTQIGVAGASITGSTLESSVAQWGSGTVTLTNTSAFAQVVYEGTVVSGSGGGYVVGINPNVAGFVATDADKSSGYYVIQPGGTITVPIGSDTNANAATQGGIVAQELAEDAAANSITSGQLAAGIKIVSSSAIVATGYVQPTDVGTLGVYGQNTGFFSDATYAVFTTDQGYVPTEADVDTANNYIWTAQDLTNWEGYVNSARAAGILNLAPMMSEYEAVNFATSEATQYIRAAALYSGGIAYDLPPSFVFDREPAFLQSVEEEIQWANQNGLRSSITLSPADGNDTQFLVQTQQLIADLQAANAMPSQIVVKNNGGAAGTSTVMYSTTSTDSLNGVANWLSGLTLTPTNSESGLETRGVITRPDDVMTGVQSTETITGAGAALPYSIAQIFAENPNTSATVTVTIGNAALGSFTSATGGTISQNGSVYSVTGNMAQITAALEALGFTAKAGALGSTTFSIAITDAAGTINGSTAVTIDNTLSLSGITSALSASTAVITEPSAVISAGVQTAPLTETITLSNTALGSFWNTAGATVSADGSTVTLTGSAATLQAFLHQLVFMPSPGVSGTETQTVTITDGTDTVSGSTTIAVASATGVAADNVPVGYVSAALTLDAPYQNILLADAGSPNTILTATVTLPSGIAHLVDSVGTVSANGLSYSYSGTAAQLQTALRDLQVLVPAAAGSATEALTLTLSGSGIATESATTMLKVVSTDTVYVGATDSNQSTYANPTIATPLLATGEVGLYQDYSGMTGATDTGSTAALASTWSGASAGVFGYGAGADLTLESITIHNSGTGAITIPVGTLASTAGGVQFQVVQYSGTNANWSAGSGDGSVGVYTIAAGGSITVPVEALSQGYVGNVANNQITTLGGNIAGASITSSTALSLTAEVAGGTITLTNTTSSYQIVTEGMVVTNASGSYQIGNSPSSAYYISQTSDHSAGYYYLAPGASTTVPIYSANGLNYATDGGVIAQIQAQTTTAINSITGSGNLPTGVVIAGSSAISLTGPSTAAQAVTWGNEGPGTGVLTQLGYGTFVTAQGFAPSETDTNYGVSTLFTSSDLASWDAYVDTMRSLGTMNVGITVTTNTAVLDISSSTAMAELRQAALYGGGIDFDLPATYLLSLGTSALTAMVNDIKWADANGIRSTLTLRDLNGGLVDANFMQDTQSLLSKLQAAGALPSQVTVLGASSTAAPTNSELPNMVAQYVAGLNLLPTTSESGLSTTGSTTVRSIMTGVQQTETVTGSAAISPYAGVQVFGETGTDQMTATVALNSTSLGMLSTTGIGTVSADGSTITISGTPASIDAALQAIHYTPTSGANGNAVLDISITDSNGTIQGTTSLTVLPTLTATGFPGTLLVNGSVSPGPTMVLTAPSASEIITATIKLSGTAYGTFWNVAGATVSANGSTVTMSGNEATLQAWLRQLVFVPTLLGNGTELASTVITDGTQSIIASMSMQVGTVSGLAVSDLASSYVSAALTLDAPYQNILLADAGSPNTILTATVTLPSGIAHLVDSVGTVSANGLSYSYSGTAAQLQTALRDLQVLVPAAAGSATEALTLTLSGSGIATESATTMLKVVSTDTVYVGATDSNQSTYANPTIATPLLATGEVGLYQDYSGMTGATGTGSTAALASTWSGASAGVFGYGAGADLTLESITIHNSGTGAITIPVGTLASTAGGVQFQVVQYSGTNANWSAGSGDGSVGVYTIAAGGSITVPVEALSQGYVGNVANNQITTLGGNIAGASITSSTALSLTAEVAGGTITLTNTTSSYQIVTEGMVVTNASGSYQIGNSPSSAYYISQTSDHSAGYYYLAPGASTTVPIYSANGLNYATDGGVIAQIQAQTTTAINSITGSGNLPTGVVIAGSSAISLTGPSTAAQAVTWGNEGPGTGVLTQLGYGTFVTAQGFAPSETDTNYGVSTLFTSSDLASWDAYVDTMRSLGTMNVGITVTTNTAVLDISSSTAMAELRQAALYGGGIDFDLPATYLLSLGTSALTAMVNDIKWADANGIRSTLTLRDLNGGLVDANFMQDTQSLLSKLQAAGALPSQVTVLGASSTAAPTNSELPNMVAQYVAGLNLLPTTSESGLSTTGSTTVRSIMTGVQQTETVTGSAAISPYAGVQVFGETGTDQMTATVALNSTSLGMLSTTGIGTVSADGSTITISGTPASIDAALQAIHYTPTAGASGKAVLDISITDSNGTIQGTTSLSVSSPVVVPPVPLMVSGFPYSLVVNGTVYDPNIVVTAPSSSDIITATLKLSSTALGSFANIGAATLSGNGSTLTMSGNEAKLQAWLDQLVVVPASGSNGTETLSGTFVDGNQVIAGAIVMQVQTPSAPATPAAPPPVPLMASGFPYSLVVNGTVYDPNIVVTAPSTTDIVTATLSLSNTALGSFANIGAATLSGNGSTLTMSGNEATLQAWLDQLLVVPASASNGTETLYGVLTDGTQTIAGAIVMQVETGGAGAAAAGLAAGTPVAGTAVPVAVSALSTAWTTIAVTPLASDHDTLKATAGGTVNNGTFTIGGSAAADQQILDGLMVTPGTGLTAPNLQISTSGAGISLVDSNTGRDTIISGGGDAIQTGSGTTTVDAGLNDTISAGSGSVFASGSQYFSFIGGSSAGDTVTGGAGGGSFHAGSGGHSLLTAGSGTTYLYAGGANDTLVGGASSTLYGDNSGTVMDAGEGNSVRGGAGSVITGPSVGGATIDARVGNETVLGGAGSTTVTGGTGTLAVKLSAGSAAITAGSGAMTVQFGSGSATVNGGSGSGTVTGGSGSATIIEGTGKEVYALVNGVSTSKQLVASGFVSSKDMITLSGYGATEAQSLIQNQTQMAGGAGTVLTLSSGATLTLLGLSHISASNITTV